MRLPIKLNRIGWPKSVARVLRASADPRELLGATDPAAFSRAVSTLKFGATFKTTGAGRFPLTIARLAALPFPAPPVVLDVGASDGSTSLDVIRALRFRHYYSTDLNNECRVEQRDGWTYFYAADGTAMLGASDRWLAYRDTSGALPLLGGWAERVLRRAPAVSEASRRIALLNPALKSLGDARVTPLRYSVLDPWERESADLVLAANILNRTYFSDETLERVVRNLRAALRQGAGWFAVVDNRESERASLFEVRSATAEVRERIGAGADVEALVLRALRAAA